MECEVWRYNKEYDCEVSNLGRVKKQGTLLEHFIQSSGYVNMYFNGKTVSLHRLVASTFIENPENKPCVHHIDGNKQNNITTNLAWRTYKEHSVEMVKLGQIKTGKQSHMYGKKGALHPCSEANKGNQHFKGHKHSSEARLKMSIAMLGNKNGRFKNKHLKRKEL